MGASQKEQTNSQLLGTVGNISTGLNNVLNRGPQVFDQSLYAGPGDTTNSALAATLRGSKNPAYMTGAQGALGLTADVAAGNRFGQNAPGYAQVRQDAIDNTQSNINRSFLSSGTYGSDKQLQALGKGVSGTIAGLDYQNYQNDIARQERAQANLPSLLQGSMLPSQIQLGVGQSQDANSQAMLLGQQDLFRRKHDAQLGLLQNVGSILNNTAGTNANIKAPVPWWQSALGETASLGGRFLLG